MYNVLIVDDQKIPRMLFEMIVRANDNFSECYCVESAAFADDYCSRYKIDLVLMDVVMRDGSNGLDAARVIKQRHPEIKVIIVTSMAEAQYLDRAREIGVESFWYKEADDAELIDIMLRTLSGESVYPYANPRVEIGNSSNFEFTSAELAVLRELTSGKSNGEIAEKLGLTVATVKTHINHMLQKTGYVNRTKLAIEARLNGIAASNKE
jgi:two-component system vancomycin resistance associated response regulator VraR